MNEILTDYLACVQKNASEKKFFKSLKKWLTVTSLSQDSNEDSIISFIFEC